MAFRRPVEAQNPAENIKRSKVAAGVQRGDKGMPGKRLIVVVVALVVLVVLAIRFTPLWWSVVGMKGKVGFIGAHTTASMEDSSDVGYMRLRDYLRNNGYEAVQITMPRITLADLQLYDACILFAPETELEKDEIDAIHTYVQNGGGFLITGTGWAQERLAYINNITADWGFEYMNTKAYEPESTTTDYGVSVSQFTVAVLGLVEGNPIAVKITYPFVVRNSATIKITDSSKVTATLTLTGYAFGEDFNHQDLKPNKDHGEPVAEEAIIVVNGEFGSGRVIGMGDHDLYMNKWLFQSKPAENAKSMLFFLDWLTKQ